MWHHFSLGQGAPPVLRYMVTKVLQILRIYPKRKVRAWAGTLQTQGKVQQRPCYLSEASPKEDKIIFSSVLCGADLFLEGHVSSYKFYIASCLNVLCWPEGVKWQPSSWIPSPQLRTHSAFGRVPYTSLVFFCEKAGTQWKAVPHPCAHDDICLSWFLELII